MDNKCRKTPKKISPVLSRKKSGTKNVTMNYKLDMWLLKKGIINKHSSEEDSNIKINCTKTEMDQGSKENVKLKSKCSQKPASVSKPSRPKRIVKQREPSIKHERQSVLESFIHKQTTSKSKAIRKTSSSESCDLPSFKITKPVSKGNKLYKKYGVVIPSVEEVLQEKKELEMYKNKLESVQDICESNKVLSSPLKNSHICLKQHNQILDCKHLSLQKISKAVKNNLADLKDIMYEKVFNERHRRFNDKHKKALTLTTKDLTYNTSMVLFTYDQMEYMLTKLKTYLDPEDKLTEYFFKVLLPELCLRIFMQSHNMNYDNAVIYLDSRPFVENG